MPKKPRLSFPGIYHIVVRGNNRQEVFLEDSDYQTFLEKIQEIKNVEDFKLYHYCLMPNHIHFILEIIENAIIISKLMQKINLSYSAYFRKKYEYVGHLWQDRFKNFIIEKDAYLLECAAYVELNPVRAKIVSSPEEYKWSSYRFYVLGEESKILEYDPLFLPEGLSVEEARVRYQEFVISKLEDEGLQKRFRQTENFFGSQDFVRRMYEYCRERKILLRKRGRPLKIVKG